MKEGGNRDNVCTQLLRYYKDRGVGVRGFQCREKDHCTAAAQAALKGIDVELHYGSDAHVGTKYGIPFRLVFLSLDNRNEGKELEKRTEENELNEHDPKKLEGIHIKRTLPLARRLLSLNDHEKVFPHFALLNSAKCCYKDQEPSMSTQSKVLKITSRTVPPTLFKNCKPYWEGELEILAPDILVVQGADARKMSEDLGIELPPSDQSRIYKWMHESDSDVHRCHGLDRILDQYLKRGEVNGRQFVMLFTPHPRAAGEYKVFDHFSDLICALAVKMVGTSVSLG